MIQQTLPGLLRQLWMNVRDCWPMDIWIRIAIQYGDTRIGDSRENRQELRQIWRRLKEIPPVIERIERLAEQEGWKLDCDTAEDI